MMVSQGLVNKGILKTIILPNHAEYRRTRCLAKIRLYFCKIGGDNCFYIIQQIVNATHFYSLVNCGCAALCEKAGESWQAMYIAGYVLCTDNR